MNGATQTQLARLMARARRSRQRFSTHQHRGIVEYVSAWGGTTNLSERAEIRRGHAAILAAARTLREVTT